MNVPTALILFRLLLVPIIVLLAYYVGEDARLVILGLMYLGLLSDILDGIIARKLHISSEKLRRMDSQTDVLFWASIGVASWLLFPELLSDKTTIIYTIIVLEIACYAISIVKFKKETCTHSLLSKLWGLSLAVAFTFLIGFKTTGMPFNIAVIIGFLSYADVLLITLILPKWVHDVPSAFHAYLIRKGVPFKRNTYLNG